MSGQPKDCCYKELYACKGYVEGDDIILPRPDDGSLELKRYNVDFLLH